MQIIAMAPCAFGEDVSSGYPPLIPPEKLERVLTTDPGMGVVRHVDAGYDQAKEFAHAKNIKVPGA